MVRSAKGAVKSSKAVQPAKACGHEAAAGWQVTRQTPLWQSVGDAQLWPMAQPPSQRPPSVEGEPPPAPPPPSTGGPTCGKHAATNASEKRPTRCSGTPAKI